MGVQFTTALMPSLASENVVTFEEKIVFGRKENHQNLVSSVASLAARWSPTYSTPPSTFLGQGDTP